MPPTAAAMDSAATRGFLSSPRTSSRLSSNATTKKNSVISPSLIQSRAEWRRANGPSRNPTGISQKAKKPGAQGELERASAVAVHTSRTAPPAVSMRRNRASGPVTRSIGSLGSRLSRGSPSCCRPILATPNADQGYVVTSPDCHSARTTVDPDRALESEILPLLSSANKERDLHEVRVQI